MTHTLCQKQYGIIDSCDDCPFYMDNCDGDGDEVAE